MKAHADQRRLFEADGRCKARAKDIILRGFVTQGLHQAHDAVAMACGADKNGDDPVFPQDARRDGINGIAGWFAVFDEFLQQPVVEFGERFEKFRPCFMLALHNIGGNFDKGRCLALAVAPGTLRNKVAAADDLVAFANRDLPQQQCVAGKVLKRGDDVSQPSPRFVHPVHEHDTRCSRSFDHSQIGSRKNSFLGVWRHTQDAGITGQKRMLGVGEGLTRARRIQRTPCFVAELEFRQAQSVWRDGFF